MSQVESAWPAAARSPPTWSACAPTSRPRRPRHPAARSCCRARSSAAPAQSASPTASRSTRTPSRRRPRRRHIRGRDRPRHHSDEDIAPDLAVEIQRKYLMQSRLWRCSPEVVLKPRADLGIAPQLTPKVRPTSSLPAINDTDTLILSTVPPTLSAMLQERPVPSACGEAALLRNPAPSTSLSNIRLAGGGHRRGGLARRSQYAR